MRRKRPDYRQLSAASRSDLTLSVRLFQRRVGVAVVGYRLRKEKVRCTGPPRGRRRAWTDVSRATKSGAGPVAPAEATFSTQEVRLAKGGSSRFGWRGFFRWDRRGRFEKEGTWGFRSSRDVLNLEPIHDRPVTQDAYPV